MCVCLLKYTHLCQKSGKNIYVLMRVDFGESVSRQGLKDGLFFADESVYSGDPL